MSACIEGGARVRARGRRRVVYTCLFGSSERFSDFQHEDPETDFVCFTDDPGLRSDHWLVVHVDRTATDPVRAAKRIKHRPGERLLGFERSLYVDNIVRLDADPGSLFSLLDQTSAPIRLFQHQWRDCIYEEGEAVIAARYDDPQVVRRQLDLYRRLGHPEHAGLFATGLLLRRHGCDVLDEAMLEWHLQVVRHSLRDQLSLPFIARRLALPISLLPRTIDDNRWVTWPVIRGGFRMPRDFDDQTYLELNPDVDAAGAEPRGHYFDHGHREGRPYRR